MYNRLDYLDDYLIDYDFLIVIVIVITQKFFKNNRNHNRNHLKKFSISNRNRNRKIRLFRDFFLAIHFFKISNYRNALKTKFCFIIIKKSVIP